MKERPILFSAPMILALLDGRKTQTRRVVKLPHNNRLGVWEPTEIGGPGVVAADGSPVPTHGGMWHTHAGDVLSRGQPGHRLWVKETWRPQRHGAVERITYAADGAVAYEDDIPDGWRRPKAAARGNVSPLFMPRWASRLTLEIVSVRVERLQEISEEDARAEGVAAPGSWAITGYAALWESIHGAGSWAANPFVWTLTFRRVTP